MGEVSEFYRQNTPLHLSNIKTPEQPILQIICSSSTFSNSQSDYESNPQEEWLPITESRNGNVFYVTFHLLSSGIGMQALLLPVAFAILGWAWGIICLSLGFLWQLYTIFILIRLHESVPGTRYSRYLHLAITAFGPKLGKLLAIFPVMYLSGGTCVLLIIMGGGTMKLLFETICHDTCGAKSLNGVEWFLVFVCIAIAVAQLPNLNSIALISLIGAITAVGYCTLTLVLSITKGRLNGVSYSPSLEGKSNMARLSEILNALGIIALSFRGHNLILEIQGTLPSSPKQRSYKPMCRAVIVSYILIAILQYALAIGGFWAYGNELTHSGGLLKAFAKFHGKNTSRFMLSLIYILVVVNCLTSFQIYVMPVFDNLEKRYISKKKQRCPRSVRRALRLFFGGLSFFIAVAFPFLGQLAPLLGGITLPLAFAYPCFMWIAMRKKDRTNDVMWLLNLGLGCFGIVLSILLVVAASWTLADKGLSANFFKPKTYTDQ